MAHRRFIAGLFSLLTVVGSGPKVCKARLWLGQRSIKCAAHLNRAADWWHGSDEWLPALGIASFPRNARRAAVRGSSQ